MSEYEKFHAEYVAASDRYNEAVVEAMATPSSENTKEMKELRESLEIAFSNLAIYPLPQ